eukprot:TRINITY_DN64844_c0_g1_i1.p1 TRINITY_DN64844_c0_g1~~TRINITY_DN64844_c0_g1_i1.p1  ORF type:complete len:619 (+),score=137.58 TRINITY_DN64844_c0_g1_i1:26-1882(+)
MISAPSHLGHGPGRLHLPQLSSCHKRGSARASYRREDVAGLVAASACAVTVSDALRSSRERRRLPRTFRVRLRAGESAPTDYYGLLGLPAFTSDKPEIKAAHRRTVKLVHPDILGVASGDLQSIVNEAYRTLSDDAARSTYDAQLRQSKLTSFTTSRWAKDANQGLFVDESVCAGCYNCTSCAPSTFKVDAVSRKAFVDLQWANGKRDIDVALLGCPERAISLIRREDLPLVEFAMSKSRSLQGRKGPFDLLEAAHCRIAELVQPKDDEERSSGEDLREEYRKMRGEGLREDRREMSSKILRKFKSCSAEDKQAAYNIVAKNSRPPSLDAGDDDDEAGVFVDETACSRCYKCVEVASSTFAVHTDPFRGKKSHAVMQDADAPEIVKMAANDCPANAISFVPREDLPLLELAMRNAAQLQQESDILVSPFQLFEEYLVDEIIRMDLDLRKYSPLTSTKSESSSRRLAETSAEIAEAAMAIPSNIRSRLWLGISGDASAVQSLFAQQALAGSPNPRARAERSTLKADLFKLLDTDKNGFLYSPELRKLAEQLGFEGSESEWAQEYVMICTDTGCNPTEGLDFRGFSRMVDDEESGYIDDEDMAELLAGTAGDGSDDDDYA